jgi:aminoglycoside phosphotransferase
MLAPDPAVPCRDELLRRPLLHAKYRFGESLRIAYRKGDRVLSVRAKGDTLETRVWPDDRKLTALHRFEALGRTRLIAYAPEQSATVAVLDARGRTVAYAKATGAERRGLEHAADLLVPRILATEPVLVLEALRGKPVHDVHGLGAALARLHELAPPRERFTRLDSERLHTAAGVIARARPDAARAAEFLLTRLLARRDDALGPAVCLHGDANLGNALRMPGGRVALIDLEHLSAGPAAADLGQVLAVSGRPARELLRGYATVAPPPGEDALRWYTAAAILARVALPGVSRVRPDVLVKLRPLLEAAARMLAHARAAA